MWLFCSMTFQIGNIWQGNSTINCFQHLFQRNWWDHDDGAMATCKFDLWEPMDHLVNCSLVCYADLCSHLQTPGNSKETYGPSVLKIAQVQEWGHTREQLVHEHHIASRFLPFQQRVLPEVKARASSWIWQRHLVPLNSSLQSRRPLRNRIGIGTAVLRVGNCMESPDLPCTGTLPSPCPKQVFIRKISRQVLLEGIVNMFSSIGVF